MKRIDILLLRRKKLKLDHSWAIMIFICSERHSIRAVRKTFDLGGDNAALEYGVYGSEEAARGRRQTVAINSINTSGDKAIDSDKEKQQGAARKAVRKRRRLKAASKSFSKAASECGEEGGE